MGAKKRKKRKTPSRNKKPTGITLGSRESWIAIERQFQKGLRYQQSGQLDRAEVTLNRLLKKNPNHPGALHILGLIAYQTGRFDKAITLIKRSIRNDPSNALYYNNLGNILKASQRADESIACYQKATQLNPDLPGAHCNLGDALQNRGDLEEAVVCYRKALQLKSDFAEAFYGLAMAQKATHDDLPEFEMLARQMEFSLMDNDLLAYLNFALGKIHDDVGLFEKAFEYYHLGNDLKYRKRRFDVASHIQYVTRIMETFSHDFLSSRQSWGDDSERPIFIFGMPRSGTTLVEQILSSHPQVAGAGESQFFPIWNTG
jgi:Tfp pilus assembly protein PilF